MSHFIKKLRFWSCREKKIHGKGLKILVKNVPWCSSDELKIEKDEVSKFVSELCKLISHWTPSKVGNGTINYAEYFL